MSFIPWEVTIKSDSYRSCELKNLKFDKSTLSLHLIEEETQLIWVLSFESMQAFRVTTEECSADILDKLPQYGGFFKSDESPWLNDLGKGRVSFLKDSLHYIICCYDEIIEVVANGKYFFKKLPLRGCFVS